MVTAIEADAVQIRHGEGPALLEGLTFALSKGETLVLLGRNGTGKTTLLKCLAGLMRPQRGQIRCSGSIGYVPQRFETPFDYCARDIMLMGRARHVGLFSMPGPQDHRQVDAAIRLLALEHLAERKIATLSGGERQLVLFARAVASEAEILLLDEPASALDYNNQASMLTTLAKLRRDRRMTIVMTTHDPSHALELADRVLAMHGRGYWSEGRVHEACTEQALSELYGVTMKRATYISAGMKVRTIVPHYAVSERLSLQRSNNEEGTSPR